MSGARGLLRAPVVVLYRSSKHSDLNVHESHACVRLPGRLETRTRAEGWWVSLSRRTA